MRTVADRLEAFFFAPIDSRTSLCMRLSLAAFLLYAFWPRGLQPAGWVATNEITVAIYDAVILTDPYRVLMLGLLVLFALGWRAPWPGLILTALLVPLAFLSAGNQSRQVIVFTSFCVSLLPALPLWRIGRDPVRRAPIWPVRLMQIQLTVLYGVNALAKLTPSYLSGERLMELSNLSNFRADLTDGSLNFGLFVVPVTLCAIGTVLTEGWLAVGLWFRRTRWLTAAIGVAFHAALKFVIAIFMLDLASVYLYLAFLLPWRERASPTGPPDRSSLAARRGAPIDSGV